jgi:hypothetical protein
MQEDLVAISNQQPRSHQPEAIGGTGDKNPTHRGQSLKDACAVNPKPASTDANSASEASPAPSPACLPNTLDDGPSPCLVVAERQMHRVGIVRSEVLSLWLL